MPLDERCDMGMTDPLYVCVSVPEFPVQVLLRLRPELARKATVVLAGDPPLEQVCSRNARAAALGIEPGMSRRELDSFRDVVVLERSSEEERMARAIVLEAAGRFTPRVEVQSSGDSAFVIGLDMAGTARIFGYAPAMVGQVAEAYKKLNFHVQIAASQNLHTALCLARIQRGRISIVPGGQEAAMLSPLPLSALPLTVAQAETLALWGLRTLGELAQVSEVELVVRLGQQGKRLLLLARGQHTHLMVPEEPVFRLEEFVAFDAPIELLDPLLFVLGPMLDQLLARAQSRAYALATLTVRLGLEGGGRHERIIKPALPVAERAVLLRLLHLDLQAHPPAAGVISVMFEAEPGDRSKVQLGLFAPQLPEASRLDITLARIAALVGEHRVGKPRLLDTHRPDSFVMERFCVPEQVAAMPIAPRAAAVLRRFRPPQPVIVRRQGQRPSSFVFDNRHYTVEQAYGPWRRSGDWWCGQVWSWEEWDLCASAGPDDTLLCVMTHDLLSSQWRMDALYD